MQPVSYNHVFRQLGRMSGVFGVGYDDAAIELLPETGDTTDELTDDELSE